MPTPHDLIWITHGGALQGALPDWVAAQWHPQLPLVVRRDWDSDGRIPIGIRGDRRDRRAAGWVAPQAICRTLSPEALTTAERICASPAAMLPPMQAALALTRHSWPWRWGITGSAGYTLATDIVVLHSESDLDLLIRSASPLDKPALLRWQQVTERLPCRVDTQIATPCGGFSLNEWLREERVLLKTARGPQLTSHPWRNP